MLQEPVKNENLELIKVKLKESFFKLYICLETGKYFSQYTQQEKPCFWKRTNRTEGWVKKPVKRHYLKNHGDGS